MQQRPEPARTRRSSRQGLPLVARHRRQPRRHGLHDPERRDRLLRERGFGGKPLENALSTNHGEYDTSYNINAGDYYDKVYNPMLMAESVDNFISASRRDYLDGRYRAVSIADLFPEGYRRWLGNNLTGDDEIKGARLAPTPTASRSSTRATRARIRTARSTPRRVSLDELVAGRRPRVVLPADGSIVCSRYDDPTSGALNRRPRQRRDHRPAGRLEQQKFLIAMTLQYLPENAQQYWLDNMHLWELGATAILASTTASSSTTRAARCTSRRPSAPR